jgi:Asp-tRNA(Asn)/Glu-tRNA(Gln) amidotransferase A subunit family amidase
VARPGEDATLLRLAASFEQAQPWHDVRPDW